MWRGFAAGLLGGAFLQNTALLGGAADWQVQRWQAVTDQVRGGVSTAELLATERGARFSGMLDPSKLKAGFAGMQLEADLLPRKLSLFKGLQLNVLNAAPR